MMGNRCPDCGKFVSLEMGDPEVEEPTIDEGGQISVEVRLVLNCAECSTVMKETNLTLEDVSEEAAKHMEEHQNDPDHELVVEYQDNAEMGDDYRAVHRNGKPLDTKKRVPMRYMTHYYNVTLGCSVSCTCGETFDDVSLVGEETAGTFEELF
jgi:hypothetical protein